MKNCNRVNKKKNASLSNTVSMNVRRSASRAERDKNKNQCQGYTLWTVRVSSRLVLMVHRYPIMDKRFVKSLACPRQRPHTINAATLGLDSKGRRVPLHAVVQRYKPHRQARKRTKGILNRQAQESRKWGCYQLNRWWNEPNTPKYSLQLKIAILFACDVTFLTTICTTSPRQFW